MGRTKISQWLQDYEGCLSAAITIPIQTLLITLLRNVMLAVPKRAWATFGCSQLKVYITSGTSAKNPQI